MLAAATLAVGVAETTPAQGAPVAKTPTATGYTPPPIAWGDCADPYLASVGAQCGMLVVPMDYAHPTRTKIKVAVSRILHTHEELPGRDG